MSTAVQVIHGDSRVELAALSETSIDSLVTDTPYALDSIVRRFGGANPAPAKGGVFGRVSAGFMRQKWDTGAEAFDPEFWALAYRAMKPGAWLVAFGGTRTYHRLVTAVEAAGFEIRDQLLWLYGGGYPKSHGPLESMLSLPRDLDRTRWCDLYRLARQMSGSALKPAVEPILLARKPMVGNTLENLLIHGVGALNINGCRIGTVDDLLDGGGGRPLGRWPANVLHDGSPEVLTLFPEAAGQQRAVTGNERSPITSGIYGAMGNIRAPAAPRDKGGSAARFFYCAKAGPDDRLGSKHPTVKPVALMRWLVRLVTPPDGLVVDPFAGTGTTAMAAVAEGRRALVIERETAFVADIHRRLAWRRGEAGHSTAIKARRRADVPLAPLPMFGALS